jgi:uncharacterized protein (TIGR02246 family)
MIKRGVVTAVLVSMGMLAYFPRPASAQQAAVADEIKKQADRFIASFAAHDIDQFVNLFTNDADFWYIDGGNNYPDRAALRKAATPFFGSIKNFSATWSTSKTLILGPEGGVFTGIMKIQAADTTGRAIWPIGKVWTLAYQRRGGQWLIVQAHEATVPPPRQR